MPQDKVRLINRLISVKLINNPPINSDCDAVVRGEKSGNSYTWKLIRNSDGNVYRIRFALIGSDSPTINSDKQQFPANTLYIYSINNAGVRGGVG